MAKKNDKHEPVQEVSKNADQLKQVRDKIDQLDRQILKLINERAGHAGEIGRLKNLAGEEIFHLCVKRKSSNTSSRCIRNKVARSIPVPFARYSAKSCRGLAPCKKC